MKRAPALNKAARLLASDAPRFAAGRVGLISDTHGLLRPEALEFLCGCQLIIHGGDIGAAAVLDALARLAPVIAVRGNNDKDSWSQGLRETELVRVGDVTVYVIHDLSAADAELNAPGIGVVVSGHSHKPRIEEKSGVLFVNPGSAGLRRFRLPISVGELRILGAAVTARIVYLEGATETRAS